MTLPTFKPATELYADLEKLVRAPNIGAGVVLFSVGEIEAFGDYCMRAIRSCPESLRQYVQAGVSHRYAPTNTAQRLFIRTGAENLAVSITPNVSAAAHVAEHRYAAVSLKHLLDNEMSTAREHFMKALGHVHFTVLNGSEMVNAEGIYVDTPANNWQQILAERATTEEDCIALCQKIHAAFQKKYPVQRAGRWFRVHVPVGQHRYDSDHPHRPNTCIELPFYAPPHQRVVAVTHIVEFAQHLSLLGSYADELESAGWKLFGDAHSVWHFPERFQYGVELHARGYNTDGSLKNARHHPTDALDVEDYDHSPSGDV